MKIFHNIGVDGNDRGMVKSCFIVLLIVSQLFFVSGLGLKDLVGSDEPREAGMGVEMALTGDHVVPRLNGNAFLEKPPLFYWIESASFKIFGCNSFAARYPSALMASVGVCFTFLIVIAMGYSVFTAFICGLMLCAAAQFWASARTCTVDMMLAGFVTAAGYCFYRMCNDDSPLSRKCLWALGLSAALAGGVLTKSLVGIAIPGAAAGTFLFFRTIIRRRLFLADWLLMAAASLLAFLPAAAWVMMLCRELGWENGGRIVVIVNNFGRFSGSHAEHVEPFYYYLRKFPEYLQPWTIFIPLAIYFHIRDFAKTRQTRVLFLLCWLLAPYLLLTISSAKRPVYLLPLAPAFITLTGVWLAGIVERQMVNPFSPLLPRTLAIIRKILGFAFIIAGPAITVAAILLKIPVATAVLLGFPFTLTGVLMAWKNSRGDYPVWGTLLLLQILFIFSTVGVFEAVVRNRTLSSRELFEETAAFAAEKSVPVILYNPMDRIRGGAVFYYQRLVPEAWTPEELNKLIHKNTGALIITEPHKSPPGLKTLKEFKVKKDIYAAASVIDKGGR